MDELLDMIATDQSPADISDSIKDTLYAKAAERINSQRPDIAAQMFDPTIADEDGEVTREEFVNYAKHSEFFKGQMDKNSVDSVAAKQEAIAKAERAFKVFDKDNDGFITKEEFAKISKKLNKDQVDAVFNKFDKDGDGVLSFEEFKKMLNKDKK